MNDDGTYKVYFHDSGNTHDNLPGKYIKIPLMRGKTCLRVSAYIGKTFFDSGDEEFAGGEFTVREMSVDNNFKCERLTGEGDRFEIFDQGHAIRCIRKY